MRLLYAVLILSIWCFAEESKLDFMKTKVRSSSNRVIDNFSKGEFKKHLAEGPRDYGCLLFLTVLGSDSSCKICGQVHDAAVDLAKQLYGAKSNENVFVVEVDYSSSSSIISELGLDRVPQVLFLPKTKSVRSVALSDLIDSVGKKNQYGLMTGYKTENFVEFINKVGNMNIDLAKAVSKMEVILFVVGIVVVIAIVIASWKFIDKVRHSMIMYAVSGVIFYCFCIGGGMYSIIRNTPWNGGSKSNPEYINKSGRNQYTLEGYLMGAANFVGGLGVFLYVMSNRAATSKTKENGNKYFGYVPSFLAAGLLVFGWYSILSVYNLKSPHYRMGFVGMTG